jgi:hypothetical protein
MKRSAGAGLGSPLQDIRAVGNSRIAHRDVLSAGNGASAVSPQSKKRSWNAVARVSCKGLPSPAPHYAYLV